MMEEIKGYLLYLQIERGLSKNTVASYGYELHRFFMFLGDRGITEPAELSPEIVSDYIHFVSKQEVSSASLASTFSALKGFLRYAQESGALDDDLMENITRAKVPKRRPPEILTINEVKRLLAAPELDTKRGIRDRAILQIMYATGIRASELTGLRLCDVDLTGRCLKVLGKGDKERMIPIHSMAAATLETYIANVRPVWGDAVRGGLVFLSGWKKGLTRQGLVLIVRKYAAAAGIRKKAYPHILRHSVATHLLEGGMDIRQVQVFLGHADIGTTQIYTQVSNAKLLAMHEKCHPANWKRSA